MYILKKDRLTTSLSDEKRQWEAYEFYLYQHKDDFPPSAYAFATASWHYDPQHHHCPHDSWLESVVITELSEGLRKEQRTLQIKAVLLGAFHDGHLEIQYLDVHSYEMRNDAAHQGDWLYDEVRVSDAGRVIHEIEWVNGRWLIECRDISVNWRDAPKLA
ncbi:hypothetical protein ACVW0Y_004434 [Pseudomonas sp. TE3786]